MSITSTLRASPQDAQASRPVAVSELKRAWTAVQAGEFRQPQRRAAFIDRGTSTGDSTPVELYDGHLTDQHHDDDQDIHPDEGAVGSLTEPLSPRRASTPVPNSWWMPAAGERVVTVVGAAGSVGCSTVAIALAAAASSGGPADRTSRVVECSSAHTSGLAAASTAELGRHESGWVQGMREAVLLERTGEVLLGLDEVAPPAPLDDPEGGRTGTASRGHLDHLTGAEALTVIDTGWDIEQLAATGSWVGQLTRTAPVVIVVARPTIPGFRRLEAALELLEHHDHAHGLNRGLAGPMTLVAVVGGRRKRWAKGVEHSAGPRTRAAMREKRVHEIPEDRQLAGTGLNSAPLPPALLEAADQLLHEALAALDAADVPPTGQIGPAAGRRDVGDDLRQLPGTSPPNKEATPRPTGHLDAEPYQGTDTNPEGTAR